MRLIGGIAASLVAAFGSAAVCGQSLNVEIGLPGSTPGSSYAAAGRAGVWNQVLAAHGTTESGLVDLAGAPTPVTLRQIGGLQLVTADDPATSGEDAMLLDDYLVTLDESLESCLFFDRLQPGTYEVLIYARMPQPEVLSDTSADQEPGIPHYAVGGEWTGQHAELVSYSRHLAPVGVEGELNLHSGIVPGAEPSFGAALNAVQLMRVEVYADGYESGDLAAWSGSTQL